ncbi:phage tail tape measure protein [Coprococcus sp. CLA-AA-H212]|uniref:Phage tail tape measure protein n=1 Tax=Coprococcus hominis (ex Arizal et al. 2022) TaxID=2881262 RepID=A0ABS8FQP1_9FIRM|nr:phage tail tape measure protein [Coprococcus hominis (ex Arizal et al. 2022)]
MGQIKGITIEIDGKTTGLTKALKAANSEIKTTKSQLNSVEKALKLDPKNVDLLKAKQNALNEVIKETKEKLDMEKQAAESAKKELELGNITQGEYDALQAEIVTTTNELSNLEKQARQASSVLGSQMQAAGAHIKEVGNNISGLGEKVTGVGDKVSALGGKMTATITMPVVAGGTAAVKEATDYSSALAKLSTIADTTQTPLDDLDSSIMALSDSTGMGAAEIAEASYQAISAGQSTKDAVGFVEQANVLARAGFTSMTTATDTLTTALNAYGLSADQVSSVSDKLITTQNLGKTTVDELGASMGKVIPTAAMYGVNLDQLSAAYVTTTKNGIGTAEATTYINGMLNELGKSGSTTSNILKEKTGKSFSELMNEGYNLSDVLQIIQNEADSSGMSLADMFGSQEAAKAAATITQHTTDFTSAVKELGNSAGTAQQAFDTLEASDPSIQFEKTKTAIQNCAISIGQILMPIVQQIAGKIQELVQKFRDLDPETQQQIVKIAAIAAAIGPLLVVIGTLISSVGHIITFSGQIVSLVGSITTWMGTASTFITGTMIPAITGVVTAIGPFLLIAAAVIAVITAIIVVIKNWDAIVEVAQFVWESFCEKVSQLVTAFKEFFTSAFQAIGSFFTGIWNGIVSVATNAWSSIRNVFSTVGSFFTGIFQQAWNGITSIFNRLGGFFSGVWNSVTGIFKSAGMAIGNAISGAVKTAVNFVLSKAIGIINGFIGAINAVIGVINKIPGVSLSKISKLGVPQLERGGVLAKGQVGLLEGNGAEAVVPLDQNEKWIAAVAREMKAALAGNQTAMAAGDIVIPVYIGQSKLNDIIVRANQITNYRSGGR